MNTFQWILLAVACVSLTLNAATAYLVWQVWQRPEIRIVHLPELDSTSLSDATRGAGAAPASTDTSEFSLKSGISGDGDAGPRLHTNGQCDATKVVAVDDHPVLAAGLVNGDFRDADRDVTQVRDLNPDRPFPGGHGHEGYQPNPKTHGIAPNRPPSVKHAERRADHSNPERKPFDPAHRPLPPGAVVVSAGPLTALLVAAAVLANETNADRPERRP